MIDTQQTLGEIVLKYPDTVKVMNQYKIDYCCNGHETLALALDKTTGDPEMIIKDLAACIGNQKVDAIIDWKHKSMKEIIHYILTTHHVFMKETLEELNYLMFKILKVHFKDHGEQLLKVHLLVGTLKTELEAHMVKEEENLFPMIEAYEATGDVTLLEAIRDFIQNTEDEHDAAGDLFKKLEIETNDFTPPVGACNSYRRTFELIDALEKDTFNHIHLENSVLFTMIGL